MANPNTLSNYTAEPMFDIPLGKLNGITRCKLCELQAEDNCSKSLCKLAKDSKEGCLGKDGVLMSTVTDHGVKRKVIVIPKPLIAKILLIAHNHLGHFDISNTCSLINRQFNWPYLAADVKTYVQSCKTCQMNLKQKPSKAPLQSLT